LVKLLIKISRKIVQQQLERIEKAANNQKQAHEKEIETMNLKNIDLFEQLATTLEESKKSKTN
jgi:N-glycosylase/DNA lyase